MKWLGSHCSFVVETFFTNSGSITATQRLFRTHFKLGRHDPVPSRNTILLWIKNFRKNGSALKRRSTGRPRTSTTPENAMAVKASVQQSPQRSARKHAAALRNSSQRTANASVQDYVGTRTKRKWLWNPKSFVFGNSTKCSYGCFGAIQRWGSFSLVWYR